jgi:putative ABC transport system permease protein
MIAVLHTALREMRRRRLQSSVLAGVALLSALAATMALTLLLEANAPYERAFSQANGPHLIVSFDGAKATAAMVAATRHASGVTQAIGPLPLLNTQASFAGGGKGVGAISSPITIAGRDRPDLPVDRLTMFRGRWPRGKREVVLSASLAKHSQTRLGDTVRLPALRAAPTLTVVGIAGSISSAVDAWTQPAAIESWQQSTSNGRAGRGATRWLMEYRTQHASRAGGLARVLHAITLELPPGAVAGSSTWLADRQSTNLTAAVMVPFLAVFSVLALLAAAFVVANVVVGVTIAGRRQIGIMKSVGFTPVQTTGVLIVRVLLPVEVGAAVGVLLGSLASQPLLGQTASALGLPTAFRDAALVDVAVLLLLGLLSLGASALPAARAGRVSVISAIARASGPSSVRGGRTIRRLGRLGCPAPVRLGLADLAGRPLRGAMTAAAVLFGVASVAFALALSLSLGRVASSLARDQQVQVDAQAAGGNAAATARLIRTTSGTARFVGEAETRVMIPGLASTVPFYGYESPSAWVGYTLISGRWFNRPDEVVAPSRVIDLAGLRVGQTFTAATNGRSERLRLVGEIFDDSDDNLLLRGTWSALRRLDPHATIDTYEIQLAPKTNPRRYAATLQARGGNAIDARPADSISAASAFRLIKSVLATLAIVLAVIAAAGVLNTVALATSERRREIAILKAVGMDPRQVVTMVVAAVVVLGLAAGLIGVPLGLALHRRILASMAEIAAHTRVPSRIDSVLGIVAQATLTLAGVAIAAAGAWLPASWAAKERPGSALQTE